MHDMRYIPDMGDVMKIGTEQLEALQRQEQTQKKTTGGVSSTGDFGALLSQELAGTEASQSAASVAPPGATGIDPLLMASSVEGVDATSADATGLDEAMAQLDGLLDNWDAYARELGQGASSGGLRGAYSMLQGIDSSLRDLKQTMPNLSDHEGLAAVVNELEVMAATEKFKFNRGDYAS
jgi:hypothetical protein